jgi:hypothetical protein
MGFIKARGSTFYYEEQGEGPPILLIAPAGSTASTWGTLVGALARMQWLAGRGRYPEAAETLLRWVYSYRDGGSARDAFPEQWRRTARENGRSVVADLKGSMGGYPAARTWRRSPRRSCAPMGREAAPTCAPSRARWPRPSRRRA